MLKRIGIGLFASVIILFASVWCLVSCGIRISGKGKLISHNSWTELLKKHVGTDGLVDYKGFIADKEKLQSYLDLVSKNPSAKS